MLSSITDRELIARLEQLRGHERDAALELLHHLNEVERRNLYLRLGYSSLFTYCVGHLCYSESDAGRRVQAARCLHRFPRVATLLKSGEINMVTLGLVANIVTESTIDQWLERIRGKSQREVEALAATVRAPITLRDRARLVNVVVPVTAPLPLAPAAKTDGKKSDGAESPPGGDGQRRLHGGPVRQLVARLPVGPAGLNARTGRRSVGSSAQAGGALLRLANR